MKNKLLLNILLAICISTISSILVTFYISKIGVNVHLSFYLFFCLFFLLIITCIYGRSYLVNSSSSSNSIKKSIFIVLISLIGGSLPTITLYILGMKSFKEILFQFPILFFIIMIILTTISAIKKK